MLKIIFKIFILLTVITLNSDIFAEPSQYTLESNQRVLQQLPFNNTQDFVDATRGFIAPLLNQGIIKNSQGAVVWNLNLYNFVDNHLPIENSSSPSSVNPSLWRQLRLLKAAGLFKVTEGIYQVRGADLANMTIVEGKTGLIIIDTLLSKETAQAAFELYYQNRPKQPIKAVIYSHSHADHFGGVKGLIFQEEVDNGKVRTRLHDLK